MEQLHERTPQISPELALRKLQEGNERYVFSMHAHKDIGESRRRELLKGQNPFAVILACSDSRVPPEIIFDQGMGELFVIRVAGNIVDTVALGSIEYAAEHLNVQLLVIMGHSKCGAVKATAEGGDVSANIAAIATKIMPSVQLAMTRNETLDDIVEDAVVENVKRVMQAVRAKSPLLKELEEQGKFRITGAKYDMVDGKVSIFEQIEGSYKELLPGEVNAGS